MGTPLLHRFLSHEKSDLLTPSHPTLSSRMGTISSTVTGVWCMVHYVKHSSILGEIPLSINKPVPLITRI